MRPFLTNLESQTLSYLVKGYTDEHIATQLNTTRGTIQQVVTKLYNKFKIPLNRGTLNRRVLLSVMLTNSQNNPNAAISP